MRIERRGEGGLVLRAIADDKKAARHEIHEGPEHRRGVGHHRIETVGRGSAGGHQQQRDRALQQQRVRRRAALLAPVAQEPQDAKVTPERPAGARAGEDRGVYRGEHRDAHDEREEHHRLFAREDAHHVRRDRLRLADAAVAEHGEVAEVDHQVERGDRDHAPDENPRHVAPRVAHFAREVGGLVPAMHRLAADRRDDVLACHRVCLGERQPGLGQKVLRLVARGERRRREHEPVGIGAGGSRPCDRGPRRVVSPVDVVGRGESRLRARRIPGREDRIVECHGGEDRDPDRLTARGRHENAPGVCAGRSGGRDRHTQADDCVAARANVRPARELERPGASRLAGGDGAAAVGRIAGLEGE